VDGIVAALGVAAGLVVTFVNIKYSNNYIISLGPIITFTCLIYLRYRNRIIDIGLSFIPIFQLRMTKTLDIIFWITIAISVAIYYKAPLYIRPITFFIGISICVTLLCLELFSSKIKSKSFVIAMILKILLTSLILRASEYFISPYPVGSDPWAHAEYIKNFLNFAHLQILTYPAGTGMTDMYIYYPLMHLFAAATCLICNLDIKGSMFIIVAMAVISTVFVYLIVKLVFGNDTPALLAILLLNFSEYSLQWGTQVIAMTFGMIVYIILLYVIVKNFYGPGRIYLALTAFFMLIILWTHTISSFIALISFIAIFIVGIFYHGAYKQPKESDVLSAIMIIIFTMILASRWTMTSETPDYTFFGAVSTGINQSITTKAGLLNRAGAAYSIERNISQILDIVGMLMLILFGILGSLYCLVKNHVDKVKVSLLSVVCVLFFIYFAFPALSLSNIIPNRWPAFIYATLAIFSGLGILLFINRLNPKPLRITVMVVIVFIYAFFMITNIAGNLDSNIYSLHSFGKLIYTESDMAIYTKISQTYTGWIVCDPQAAIRPFEVYLRYPHAMGYPMAPDQIIDLKKLRNKATIWDTSLGSGYKDYFDGNLNPIIDTGKDRVYI
jgi:hypothetical protein